MKEDFRLEDWMDLPTEEGTNVISLPRIINIPSAPAALTINFEEGEVSVPEVCRLGRSIEVQAVASTTVPFQPTYLLP